MKAGRWTKEEIALLRRHYPAEGRAVANRLPCRSVHAVHVKAHRLGLVTSSVNIAPVAGLDGERLERAIHLRETEGWSFARIGRELGVCEASATNAVLIALCPRKGFTPAQRDSTGRLTQEGIDRLRLALRMGLKGVDIQLRLGLSASRIAHERRRYSADLKARGKAPLPPPGKGEHYSGVKLSPADRKQIEDLLLQGYGTLQVHKRTGLSRTSIGRLRNRLIARLARSGRTLPGCDARGHRLAVRHSAAFITPEQEQRLVVMLRDRVPVLRAARECVIGQSAAYKIRDRLRETERLPPPRLPGRVPARQPSPLWPPKGIKQIYAFRELLQTMAFDEAKQHWRAQRREELNIQRQEREAARSRQRSSFEAQLAAIENGAPLVANPVRPHLQPQL